MGSCMYTHQISSYDLSSPPLALTSAFPKPSLWLHAGALRRNPWPPHYQRAASLKHNATAIPYTACGKGVVSNTPYPNKSEPQKWPETNCTKAINFPVFHSPFSGRPKRWSFPLLANYLPISPRGHHRLPRNSGWWVGTWPCSRPDPFPPKASRLPSFTALPIFPLRYPEIAPLIFYHIILCSLI